MPDVRLCFKKTILIDIPTGRTENVCLLTFGSTVIILFDLSHLSRWKIEFSMLICISLGTGIVEHILLCFFGICISLGE